jgi:site-specific DNA-cytosine methylase
MDLFSGIGGLSLALEGTEGNATYTFKPGLSGHDGSGCFEAAQLPKPVRRNEWTSQPVICGRTHGISHRVDRLRCLGNAVVPLQARVAFERLLGL